MPISSDLAMLIAEIEASLSHAESICHGLTREQFNWSPQPGAWSIAQCISHLNVVDGMDLGALKDAIDQGRAAGKTGEGPFTYGLLARKFIQSMEPGPRTGKHKAPAAYQPPPEADLDSTLREFRRIGAELRRLAQSADGLHLVKVKTRMPALPAPLRAVVRFPLGARFLLLTTHDRRHLMQAENCTKPSGLPRRLKIQPRL